MPMCQHHECRCRAAEYRSRQADEAEARGDHPRAARLSHEAVQCHFEMVVCTKVEEEPLK
jgi:hypothetical protein